MNNNLFKLTKDSKEIITISATSNYYITYNRYLQQEHLTDIKENEDFIPMDTGKEIILILTIDEDEEPIEAELVFDVMEDMLYMRV